MAQEEQPRRALVVAAHPDDAEFGCAGTAALWTRSGWEFYYLICTDGSKGSEDPAMAGERLVAARRQEQRAAAAILGVKDVFYLGHEDGTLTYGPALMRDVVRYIRQLRPRAVFTHYPEQILRENGFINHPDHRCVGTVTVDAVYPLARNRPSFPELLDEGLGPHKVQELYLWEPNDPNFSVDVTTVEELKFRALMAHHSQFQDMEEQMQAWRQRWWDEQGRVNEKFLRLLIPF